MPATSTLLSSGTDRIPSAFSQGSETASEPGYRVIRRNGSVTPFDATKITVALTKAFLATEGSVAAGSRRVHDVVEELAGQVFAALTRRADADRTFHIEAIQDQVELALMRSEHHKVARAYVLYMHFIANRRCAQLGLQPVFAEVENPFPWMSEAMDLKKEKNFFETRVIEYQNGGALAWD